MKIKALINELKNTKHFKDFKQKNPDSFFTAAFLILNLENPSEHQIQLDYFTPSTKQIAAFSKPFKSEPKIHNDIISIKKGQTTPKPIESMTPQSTEIKLDIENLESEIKKIIEENNSKVSPTKIIAILKDEIWNLTCMDNALGIVRIKINPKTSKLIDFNKGSLMDFMGMKKK